MGRRGTKGPRLRSPPGSFIRLLDEPGRLYVVVLAYRLVEDPSSWIYVMAQTLDFSDRMSDHYRIWYAPVEEPPFNQFGRWTNARRIMKNQDMLRLGNTRLKT